MTVTINPFIQHCTQGEPCGEVLKTNGHIHLVQRYAVWLDGKLVKLSDHEADAREFVTRKGWTLAT